MTLTTENLRALYRYDADTGLLHRLVKIGRNAAGPVQAKPNSDGYLRLCINYRLYQQHRLAWFYMTGRWPTMVDHINHVRTDNRWVNLRECDQSLNQHNRAGANCTSSTGLLGAFKRPGDKFGAGIQVRGKFRWLGLFDTAEAAHRAYMAAKQEAM